jgi:hypothetical protein
MRRRLQRGLRQLSRRFRPPAPRAPAAGSALHVETPEQFGELVFGPVLFAFMAWLMRHPAISRLDRLYFASREGWALEALYRAMRDQAGRDQAGRDHAGRNQAGHAGLPPASYLPCSRRAVLAAQMGASVRAGGPLDVSLLTASSPWFEGTIEELLRARIGLLCREPAGLPASRVALMRDAEIVHCVAGLMADEITPHVQQAHADFECYATAIGLAGAGQAGLVDVGYSATIQSAIQKTLGISLVGFYMAVTEAARKTGEEGGYAFGAFAEGGEAAQFGGAFGLFLEAVLSAPHGQVIGYAPTADGGGTEPVFDIGGAAQQAFPILQRIHAGIHAYCLGRMAAHGLQPEADPFATLRRLGAGAITVAPEIRRALFVEDAFCGNGEIDVLARAGAPATS